MTMDAPLESHPLQPWVPEGARLLLCGTFPPPRQRWSMEFYYPNFINDMWRVFGLIFFDNKDALVDAEGRTFRLPELKRLLTERGIALSDTGSRVERLKGNASDKFLNIAEPFPLDRLLLRLPLLTDLGTTGEKAAGVVASLTGTPPPAVGTFVEVATADAEGRPRRFRHWRMPSTSRAYPLPLAKKAEAYRRMMLAAGVLE